MAGPVPLPTHDRAEARRRPELRPPEVVMRLARMGAAFPTRLSFNRVLIRHLAAGKAQVRRPVWAIDAAGYGRAVYVIELGGYTYSLVAFATPLDDEARSDRVIAEAWDTTYALYDGMPDAAELDRLEACVPLQEAGRFSERELVLSRANKSVRLFAHVMERLAAGLQPDDELIRSTGYLMRTTAVYGNGKFGIADRMLVAERPGLNGPFQVEMLTVWLIREFTVDLIEHIARCRAPETFKPLSRRLKRYLGIGNATGLGMAPFLVSHPILFNNWMQARETALARASEIEQATPDEIARAERLLARARRHLAQWHVEDSRQCERLAVLRRELDRLAEQAAGGMLQHGRPWQRLLAAVETCSFECQELVAALVIEMNGDCSDNLADQMASDVDPRLEPAMVVSRLRELVDELWGWALATDFSEAAACERFWYVSEEKLEPRLGNRFEEPGAELEMPLDIARRVRALRGDLERWQGDVGDGDVAAFLAAFPQHRFAVRRVQTLCRYPYAEIRDNLIASACLPIDMLRCKLAFFGAVKFDPKSDRWTRITLYQGAPLSDELAAEDVDDWWLPVLEPA
jgi:hypothetical protein